MKSKIFLLVFFSTLPFCSQASVYINEIGWQGTENSSFEEWVEIYNDGEETSLEGWGLYEAGGDTLVISLAGTISGGEYFLVCRTTASMLNPLGGICNTTGTFSGSGFNNTTGEYLVLKNNSGEQVDSVDASSGWDDLEDSTPRTYSYFNGDWKPGEPTPKSENISLETEEESLGDAGEEDGDEEKSESTKSSTATKKQAPPKPKEPKAEIQSSSYGFVGVPISIKSYITDTDGSETRKGLYVWNMGDGTVLYKAKKEEFQYTYQYPGEYVVSLSYSQGAFGRDPKEIKPLLYDEQVVNITDKTLTFETLHHDGSVTLKNNSSQVLPVENWKLSDGSVAFTIPQKTMVRAGKTITFPSRVTYLKNAPVYLFNPSGEFVDSSEHSNASILPKAQASEISSQALSSEVSSDGDDITKETILSLKDDFKEENLVAGASFSQQKTLYMTLFGLMVLLVGIIIWILFSYKKEPKSIEEYEIIEQ